MNTEPMNKESYPRPPAHFQLQYRKKQAVVTENSGNTKILLAFPLVLCYVFSVFSYTTVSNYYFILLLHTRDKENRLIFKQSFFAANSQTCSSLQIGRITKEQENTKLEKLILFVKYQSYLVSLICTTPVHLISLSTY